MVNSFIRLIVAGFFAGTLALAANAAESQKITWDDLVPPRFTADSPLASLTPEQQSDVSFIAEVRAYLADGMTEEDNGYVEVAKELETGLRSAGLDVEALVAEAKKISKQSNDVVKNYDGKSVRIPGYVLPLEFEGDTVKEFLLVPYVGACIHTPPPPENQIVYVKLDQPIKVKAMFEPVWASGTLSAQQSQRNLHLVDGSSDIAVGYQLQATTVEPYTQE
ncbi:MAG: DUF3299 domain-containing protein [Hyphomicrobiales bacterium]